MGCIVRPTFVPNQLCSTNVSHTVWMVSRRRHLCSTHSGSAQLSTLVAVWLPAHWPLEVSADWSIAYRLASCSRYCLISSFSCCNRTLWLACSAHVGLFSRQMRRIVRNCRVAYWVIISLAGGNFACGLQIVANFHLIRFSAGRKSLQAATAMLRCPIFIDPDNFTISEFHKSTDQSPYARTPHILFYFDGRIWRKLSRTHINYRTIATTTHNVSCQPIDGPLTLDVVVQPNACILGCAMKTTMPSFIIIVNRCLMYWPRIFTTWRRYNREVAMQVVSFRIEKRLCQSLDYILDLRYIFRAKDTYST